MSNNFESLIQEVESDIRQERFEKIWKEYGKKIVAGFVVIIGLSAAYNIWQHNQIKQRDIISQQFTNAQTLMFSKNYGDALAAMENIAKSSHYIYATLAKFNVAGILRQESNLKDLNKAADIYQEIIKDRSLNANIRNLASVLYATLKIDDSSLTSEQLKEQIQSMDEIANKDGCYKYLALEVKGMIYFRMKDYKTASDIFMEIMQAEKASRDVKLRSQVITQHMANISAELVKVK